MQARNQFRCHLLGSMRKSIHGWITSKAIWFLIGLHFWSGVWWFPRWCSVVCDGLFCFVVWRDTLACSQMCFSCLCSKKKSPHKHPFKNTKCNNYTFKCLKTTLSLIYFVELCTYISTMFTTMFKLKEINYFQGNGVFHFACCCWIPWVFTGQRVRKEAGKCD